MVVDVSVVLPTYNERESIGLLSPRLASALAPFSAEVIVVDDASPDGTAERVESLPPAGLYRVVRRSGRLGLASAVLEGVAQARGRVVVVMDADGSHPPELIPSLVAPVLSGGCQFAIASRNVPGGGSPGLTGLRRAISFVASLLARPLTRVRDPMSGFFAFDRTILDGHRLQPVGYKIALEILVRCRPEPVREVPYRFESRLAGESKLNGNEMRSYLRHLARLYWWRMVTFGRASRTR